MVNVLSGKATDMPDEKNKLREEVNERLRIDEGRLNGPWCSVKRTNLAIKGKRMIRNDRPDREGEGLQLILRR